MNRVWTQEEIKDRLETNDAFVGRALLKLYELQTEDEKESKETKYYNGVGFNGFDAEVLTGLAKWYSDNQYFTPKQLELVRKKLKKYSGQITRIANNNVKGIGNAGGIQQ